MEDDNSCIGIRYLSEQDIIKINKAAISVTPHEISGFINQNNLLSAQQSPSVYRWYESCEDIFTLASVLFIKLVKSHIFQNGNKRTAYIASVMFLRLNGYIFEPPIEVSIEIALKVAQNETDYDNPVMLSSWFKAFSRIAEAPSEEITNQSVIKLLS